MKLFFSFCLFIIAGTNIFAQVDSVKKADVTVMAEQMPSFPGGDQAMMKWIINKIATLGYPSKEAEAGISGKVYVTFVIDTNGNVTDTRILKGIQGGAGYDEEALLIVNSMPKWNVGKQNGRPVNVQYNLPIQFTIMESGPAFNPQGNKHYNKGVEYSQTDFAKAAEEFTEALKYIPGDVDALYNRGVMYLKLGKTDEACKDWNAIKAQGKNDADGLINKYCK